jgi:hypothetical protein
MCIPVQSHYTRYCPYLPVPPSARSLCAWDPLTSHSCAVQRLHSRLALYCSCASLVEIYPCPCTSTHTVGGCEAVSQLNASRHATHIDAPASKATPTRCPWSLNLFYPCLSCSARIRVTCSAQTGSTPSRMGRLGHSLPNHHCTRPSSTCSRNPDETRV